MFDHLSRYWSVETAYWTRDDGVELAYKRRRFVPQPEGFEALAEWPVRAGDRFDLVAGRTLGDAEAYWRIADANRAMDPLELETPGRRVVVPLPRPGDT